MIIKIEQGVMTYTLESNVSPEVGNLMVLASGIDIVLNSPIIRERLVKSYGKHGQLFLLIPEHVCEEFVQVNGVELSINVAPEVKKSVSPNDTVREICTVERRG